MVGTRSQFWAVLLGGIVPILTAVGLLAIGGLYVIERKPWQTLAAVFSAAAAGAAGVAAFLLVPATFGV